MKHIFLFLSLFFAIACLQAQQVKDTRAWDQPQSYKPMVSQGEFLGNIPPLRTLPPLMTPAIPTKKTWSKRNYFRKNKQNNPTPQPVNGDPLVNAQVAARSGNPQITELLNFDGIGDLSGITPPDPTGDVGKNHYVQMVNANGGAWFQIWDKQGQSVYGPALTSTIWSQVGSGSIGDPIIQYDQAAQRWLMMEMRGFGVNDLLIAVSDNSDPTGSWKAFSFPTYGFPDYPKLYIWNNAYFVTINEIAGGNLCSGYALERSALLNGSPNFKTYRFQMPNYLGIQYQPATGVDWAGGPPPPPGTPGMIMRVYDDIWDGGTDHLEMWKVNVDWQDTTQSSLEGPELLYPAFFETAVCNSGLFNCIEQPDPTAPNITALDDIIMYSAPYRNLGDHESIVLNHVVDVSGVVGPGGDAEVRWYELRRTGGGPWGIYQQGTYAPDVKTNRFMGTITMDDKGNIGLGYSVCDNTNVFPGLRLTGRRVGDPLNQMTIEEHTVVDGQKSHGDERWGDYSSMVVDPEDGRTFWFTGEYQPSQGNWATRITSFLVRRDSNDISPISLVGPQASATLGNAETVKVEILNNGILSASGMKVSLYADGALITTDPVASVIAAGETKVHTFSVPVPMGVVGKTYKLMMITNWQSDGFSKNDTLRASVRHLTSDDAQAAGRVDFPGVICGNSYGLSFLLKNAGEAPLQSAKINWKINGQSYTQYNWTGNLAPGASDTVSLPLTGINDGSNFFYANTSSPNGVQDQDVHNDSTFFKFTGNLDGTYMEARANTESGGLKMELRTLSNSLVATREFQSMEDIGYPVCAENGTCYKLILTAKTLKWKGHFRLYDIFGNILAEATEAKVDNTVQPINVCTPTRKQVDVGPFSLSSPVSGPNLGIAEPVKVIVRNFGLTDQSNIDVAYRLDGGLWHTETIPGVLPPAAQAEHVFATTEDLSTFGSAYQFDIRATVPGDQLPTNDQKQITVYHRPERDLAFKSLSSAFVCSDTTSIPLKLSFENLGQSDISTMRLQYSLNGLLNAPFSLTPGISSGQSYNTDISISGSKFGSNQLKMWIVDVNDKGKDFSQANDTLVFNYAIYPDGFGIYCSVLTDTKPEETSWDIVDLQGNIVASQGPFTAANTFYSKISCLKKDQCYKFRLHDSGQDGMNGMVQIETADTAGLINAYFGGNFGSLLEIPFCATSPCAGFTLAADVTSATDAGVANGSITVQTTGGNPDFMYSLDGINFQSSPVFNGLLAGNYTIYTIDGSQCKTQLSVTIGVLVAANEPKSARQLMISPNPTRNLVWVELPARDHEKNADCYLYDQSGKLIQTFRMSRWDDRLRGMFSLEKYPVGVYILKVSGLSEGYGARIVRQ
ncbi:MAG: CARDB domain-containing protein [Bacteroidota bacterium]